jgi:hypothetical protein
MEKLHKILESNLQKKISGIEVPKEIYWVLDDPAPLAGMRYPDEFTPWLKLYEAGFSSLISLEPIPYDPNPLKIIFRDKLQDLIGVGVPQNPEEETQKIIRAVKLAKQSLLKGEGVLVQCWGGTGRTGTVLGCILREFGYSKDETISYLYYIHKERGKSGWPESPWQSNLVRDWIPEDLIS